MTSRQIRPLLFLRKGASINYLDVGDFSRRQIDPVLAGRQRVGPRDIYGTRISFGVLWLPGHEVGEHAPVKASTETGPFLWK